MPCPSEYGRVIPETRGRSRRSGRSPELKSVDRREGEQSRERKVGRQGNAAGGDCPRTLIMISGNGGKKGIPALYSSMYKVIDR